MFLLQDQGKKAVHGTFSKTQFKKKIAVKKSIQTKFHIYSDLKICSKIVIIWKLLLIGSDKTMISNIISKTIMNFHYIVLLLIS